MSSLLSYKKYNGTVEYSDEDECHYGKVVGIKSIQELKLDFETVIDEYLEDCKAQGVEPEVPHEVLCL